MGTGPLWEAFIGTDKKNCQQTWWLSLLYLNNYIESDKTVNTRGIFVNKFIRYTLIVVLKCFPQCGYHTWFMPCEFHFTLIGIGLAYVLNKKPKIGMYLTSFFMALSIAIPFALTYIGQKPANIQFNME